MKKIDFVKLPPDKEIADAATSPVHTDEYNRQYKEWRCREGNRFAFSGKRESTRHTYVDGMGVQDNSPAARERSALQNICRLIALLVFVYEISDNILGFLLILIFKMFGVEISYSFHDSIAYGNQYAVMSYILIEGAFKLLVPTYLVGKILKIPPRIAAPVSIKSPWHVAASMSAASISFALLGALRLVIPFGMIETENIGMTYGVLSYMNGVCSVVYILFDMLLLPILFELLFHGALFQALRQFGIIFTIIFTALLNTVVMHDPYSFTIIFFSSVIAGIGIWKSGSILTGMIVSCQTRVLSFLYYYCEEMPELWGIPAIWVCVFLMFISGLLGLLALSVTANGNMGIKDYTTFITYKEKIKICTVESSMLAVWILCFTLMVIEIVL